MENSRKTHFRFSKLRWSCILIPLICFPFFRGTSQATLDYGVHANIIYQLTKYINWPDEKKSGEFIIVTVGETPMTDELKRIASNKTVGGQKITVKNISVANSTFSAHILFVTEEAGSQLKKITAKTAGMPILIIGESEGMTSRGACINFAVVSDKLKLEINPKNIEQRSLSIASELLKLGTIVK